MHFSHPMPSCCQGSGFSIELMTRHIVMGLTDGGRIEGVLEIDCQSIRPIFGYQLQHSRAWNPCAEVNRPRNASNALIQDASHASLYFAERFIVGYSHQRR